MRGGMSMNRIIVTLLIIALPVSVHAAEGGLSNYVPAFYGDLGLAVEPPDGFSFRNDVFYYSGDIGGSLRSGKLEANADVTLIYDYLSFLYKPKFRFFAYRLPSALLRQ